MVESRRVPLRSQADESSEPLLDLARRKAREDGVGLRTALNSLRAERRQRALDVALAEAPAAVKNGATYQRVSTDPRWPWGVEDERAVAPFGFNSSNLPRTHDGVERRDGPRPGAQQAKREAREIIAEKLARMGCDPIVIMAEMAMDKEMKPEVRLRAAAELSTMVYPRLRGVESLAREEKTIYVIGVPSERPADAAAWLAGAQARLPSPIIEATAVDVTTDAPTT